MYQVIIVIQVLVGLGIIGLVLMQHGKGADAGAAFGSGASGTVFGAQGSASFLSRATAILAVVFFASSLGLAVLSGRVEKNKDIMDIPEEESLVDVPLTNSNSNELPSSVPTVSEQKVVEDTPVAAEPESVTEVVTEQTAAENTMKVTEERSPQESPSEGSRPVTQEPSATE